MRATIAEIAIAEVKWYNLSGPMLHKSILVSAHTAKPRLNKKDLFFFEYLIIHV